MPFIGNQPADKFLTLEKQVFTTSATDTYTLDREVSSVNDIELFLNNVRQEPTEAYTISGTTLTLASAITASDSMYCIYQGRAVGTTKPANNTVTGDMLVKPFTYDDASNGSVTGISVNNDYPTTSTASAGTGSGIRFGVNDGSFTSAFGDARGSEILSVTQQSNGRTRDIVFKTDNGGTLGEKMRILASGGITFNGDTASANALDDYEEGTWTPSLTSSGGSISVSYGTRTGKYTKVGNTVHCSFVMRVASHSGGSGEYRVSGLPFSSSTAGSDHTGVTTAALEGHPFTASTQLLQVIDNNQTYIRLLRGNNDSSWNSYTPQSNNSVYMSFTYPTT